MSIIPEYPSRCIDFGAISPILSVYRSSHPIHEMLQQPFFHLYRLAAKHSHHQHGRVHELMSNALFVSKSNEDHGIIMGESMIIVVSGVDSFRG